MDKAQGMDIKKYAQLLFEKRVIFAVIVAVVASTIIAVSYLQSRIYEATSTVMIERNFLDEVMKDIAVTATVDDRIKALEVTLKSRAHVKNVLIELDPALAKKSEKEVAKRVEAYRALTEVKLEPNRTFRRDMDLFTVSARNVNPAAARDYVNTLIRRYVDDSLKSKQDETFGANRFLMGQINLFKEKNNAIEREIGRLSREKDYIAQKQMAKLQARLDELRMQYTDNHPDVAKVRAEIDLLKTQLQKKTGESSAYLADIGQEQGTAQPQGNAKDRGKVTDLERERETYRKIYQDLVATLGKSEVTTHIEAQEKGGMLRVLEPAVLPLKPVSPDRVKFILLGILGGLGAGVGFVILLDSFDHSVKTLDIVKSFGHPVLVVIPHVEHPEDSLKTKRRDLLLYTCSGLYLAGIATLLVRELLWRTTP
jgi:protein tyrosine kinase modulator